MGKSEVWHMKAKAHRGTARTHLEIQGRCREIQGRYRGDAWEMQGRCREMKARCMGHAREI